MAARDWSVYRAPTTGVDAFSEFAPTLGIPVIAQIAFKLTRALYKTDKWKIKLRTCNLRVVWVEVDFTQYGVVYQAAPLFRPQAKDVVLVIFKREDHYLDDIPPEVIKEASLRVSG